MFESWYAFRIDYLHFFFGAIFLLFAALCFSLYYDHKKHLLADPDADPNATVNFIPWKILGWVTVNYCFYSWCMLFSVHYQEHSSTFLYASMVFLLFVYNGLYK